MGTAHDMLLVLPSTVSVGVGMALMVGTRISVTPVQDGPVGQVPVLAGGDPPGVALPVDAGPDLQLGVELVAADGVVQDEHVVRVHGVLVGLEPVAGGLGGAAEGEVVDDHDLLVVAQVLEDVVAGEYRLAVGRAHVGEDQAVVLLHRVPGLPVVGPVAAPVGLAGLVQAGAVGGEQPAVVGAADPVVLDPAVVEGGAPVAAAGLDEAGPAAAVAEQDQVLAEDPDLAGQAGRLGAEGDRMPVAPEQLPRGGARGGLDQVGIPASRRPAVGPAVAALA